MGSPFVWYKVALENFVVNLGIVPVDKKPNEISEMSREELETIIRDRSNRISEKKFYYNAGISIAQMLEEVNNTGSCDALNAACGGLGEFEDFIGIHDDDKTSL